MNYRNLSVALGLASCLWGGELMWTASNGFEGWEHPVNCVMARQGEVLRLDVTGQDSSIANRSVAIDPRQFSQLDIVYRAKGLPRTHPVSSSLPTVPSAPGRAISILPSTI